MEGEACSACALNLCGLGHDLDGFDALEAKLATLGPKERAVLTELNLSHNNLSALPPSLFNLPHLTHLDLSFNQLPTLPAAVGGLTQLQVLNLLGNPLAALPLEMQALTELRKLKVSNVTKRKLAANPQLFLRYLKPLPFKPIKEELPQRRMLHAPMAEEAAHTKESSAERGTTSTSPSTTPPETRFRVMTYNLLAPSWTSPNDHGCPEWAHKWSYRKRKILWEVLRSRADIVCFQEIEKRAYEGYFGKYLKNLGFEGVFQPPAGERPIDGFLDVGKQRDNPVGNATFFRTSLFSLAQVHKLEFMHLIDQLPCGTAINKYFRSQFRTSDKQAMVLMLRVKRAVEGTHSSVPPAYLCVANTHIYWDPTYPSIKLMQVFLLTQAIERLITEWQRERDSEKPVPVVLCGDFNSLPNSSVYSLLSQGFVEPGHANLSSQVSDEYARTGLRQGLNLTSAYAHVLGRIGDAKHDEQDDDELSSTEENQNRKRKRSKKKKKNRKNRKKRDDHKWEPAFTNYTPSFNGTLDYIWISTSPFTSRPATDGGSPNRGPDRGDEAHRQRNGKEDHAEEEENEEEEEQQDAKGKPPNGIMEGTRLHIRGILEPVSKDQVRRLHPQSRTSLLSVTFPSDHFALVCDLALS